MYLDNSKPRKYDQFLPTLSSVFSIARFFGISTPGWNLAFCWTVVLLMLLLLLEMGAIWKIIRLFGGWTAKTTDGRSIATKLSGSIFYGNALLSLVLSLKFISSWNSISEYWLKIDTKVGLKFPPDAIIRKRTIFVSASVASCAFVEHMLSMMSATGFDCPPEEYFERYILTSHGFLLQPHEYNLWLAIPIFMLSKAATILWNFQDLIIILISMGLSSRYHRLNLYVNHVVRSEKKVKSPQTATEVYAQVQKWRRVREEYVRQAILVRIVDRELGPLVLLSNINNLYFICLQLFLGINTKSQGPLIHKFYYFISLGWLLFRACGVVLAASDVHVHSKRALTYLHSCQGTSYNIEIKRLKQQLANDFVGLSGMGFFYLNRQMLLQVAAAVLKYELVLIQYDK